MNIDSQFSEKLFIDTAIKADPQARKTILKLVDKLLKGKLSWCNAKKFVTMLIESNPYMPSLDATHAQFVDSIESREGINAWAEHCEVGNKIKVAQKFIDAITNKYTLKKQTENCAYNLVFALTVVGHEQQHNSQSKLDAYVIMEKDCHTSLTTFSKEVLSSLEINPLTEQEFDYVLTILNTLGKFKVTNMSASQAYDAIRVYEYLNLADEIDAFKAEESYAAAMLNYFAADPLASKNVKKVCKQALTSNLPNLVSQLLVYHKPDNIYDKFIKSIESITTRQLIDCCKIIESNILKMPTDLQHQAEDDYNNAAIFIISKMPQAVCFEQLEGTYRDALAAGAPILARSALSAMSIYGKTEASFRQKMCNFVQKELTGSPQKEVINSLHYLAKLMPDKELCNTAHTLANNGQTESASTLLDIINLKINYCEKYKRTNQLLFLAEEYVKTYAKLFGENIRVENVKSLIDSIKTQNEQQTEANTPSQPQI